MRITSLNIKIGFHFQYMLQQVVLFLVYLKRRFPCFVNTVVLYRLRKRSFFTFTLKIKGLLAAGMVVVDTDVYC